jgi:hypothetical protein
LVAVTRFMFCPTTPSGASRGLGATFGVLPVGEKTVEDRPSAVRERERVMGVWLSREIAEAVVAMLTETLSISRSWMCRC